MEKKNLLADYEKALQDSYNIAMRGENSEIQLTGIYFQPVSEGIDSIGNNTDTSMWANGYFRLFISHLTKYKIAARNLKICMKEYGIDWFVAHEDIRISREWEIRSKRADKN